VSRECCVLCHVFYVTDTSKLDYLTKRGQTWVIVQNVYSFMNKEMQEDAAQLSEHYRK
jgi:hypothetical protein